MADASQVAEEAARTVPPIKLTEAELFANDPLLSAVGLYKNLWTAESLGALCVAGRIFRFI